MRIRTLPVTALLLLSVALVGCGGPDDNSPRGVVERFFDRLDEQDESAVRDLLCEDFQQNVSFDHGRGREVSFDFDLNFEGEGDEDAGGDTADVLVSGKIERGLRTDDVRHEVRVQRDEAAPWTIKTFRVEGSWRVCGGDAFILSLLNTPAAFEEIE